MISESQAYIYVQLPGTLNTVPAALLKVEKLRDGTFVGRFRYGDRYLQRKDAVEFDPFQLPLGDIVREFTKLKGIPGAVRDAAPDAWGRRVIEHKLQRSPGDLEEIDYLLNGPQDGAGYLSFGTSVEPPASKRRYNRTHQLAELIAAAEAIEEGKRVPEHIFEQLEPGTSMGGARPKATIEDGNRLWLGKFPEKGDRCNLQRVEYATLELARRCGIAVCNARLETVAAHDVLMVERFDLEMTVGAYGRTASIYNVLSQCERFGLTVEAARKEIDKIVAVVRPWRDHFRVHGVSAKDIDYIASAFLPESFFFEKPPEN